MCTRRKERLIGAFLGYVRSLEFGDARIRTDLNQSTALLTSLNLNGATRAVLFQRDRESAVLKKTFEYFGNVFDEKDIISQLQSYAIECVEKGYVLGHADDPRAIRCEAEKLVASLKGQLHSWQVFIPLANLEVKEMIQLGRCKLYPLDSSQLQELLDDLEKRKSTKHVSDEIKDRATAYLVYDTLTAISRRMAESQALEAADLSLSIIRVFLLSSYYDEHGVKVKRHFGIVGAVDTGGMQHLLFVRDDPTQGGGRRICTNTSVESVRPVIIDNDDVNYLQRAGLPQINAKISSRAQSTGSMSDADQLTERLMRAISWFGKGNASTSIADSFLSYAIAVECLFSEGKTSENRYAEYVATLTRQHGVDCKEPLKWNLSKQFSAKFKHPEKLEKAFKQRFDELFKIRNKLAHGVIFEKDVNPLDLVDFESLVRNSIIAFVVGGWETLKEFKEWHSQHTVFDSDKKPLWRRIIEAIRSFLTNIIRRIRSWLET